MSARAAMAAGLLALLLGLAQAPAAAASSAPAAAQPPPLTNGIGIYARFVEGLAQPGCENASPRWRAHFAHVPGQLASGEGEVLPLFGYVVEALRSAHLPTEYALIPFVESGYRPGARSGAGPAGLWQFVAVTARDHGITVRAGQDGRLSPVEATRAAVRYLKTLHGMFAGDWRLAVMAFNAGENRVFGALRHHGQRPADARPEELESLSGITRAYVRKLHALSCLMVEAGADDAWAEAMDRPVTRLLAVDPGDATDLGGYARRHGLDPARLQRLNPGLPDGRLPPGSRILVPASPPAFPPVPAPAATPAAAPASTAVAN